MPIGTIGHRASFTDPRGATAPHDTEKNSVLAGLIVWLSRHRQRRALAEMDDHLLRDIGLSRVEALYEAAKPFWRP